MFHTVSRMREICTYGSMRGRTYPAGASRSTLHPNGGVPVVELRNFKTNQCCHLISRIANRAFFLNDEEKTR